METSSFDVMDLLADLFEFRFGVHDSLGKGGIVGLGSDGVKLTVDLLAEKIHGAAHHSGTFDVAVKLPEVGAQPGEFFCYLAAVSKERDFLEDPLVVRVEIQVSVTEAAQEVLAMGGDDRRSVFLDLVSEFLERGKDPFEFGLEVGALLRPHLDEAFEGLIKSRLQGGPDLFHPVVLSKDEDIGSAEIVGAFGGELLFEPFG